MAVQIPKLNRFAPVASATVGRLPTQQVDTVTPFTRTSNAAIGLASAVNGFVEKVENDTINTASDAANNEYNRWYKEKVFGNFKTGTFGLIHKDGDPTQAYNDFDAEATQKFDEIMKNNSELSEKGKAVVGNRLLKTHDSLYNQRLSSYGQQFNKYDSKVKNEAVFTQQQNAISAGGIVNPDDLTTLEAFNDALTEIKDIRLREGVARGTADQAEDGEITASPSLATKIKKNMSETVYATIDNLTRSGEVDTAKFMLKGYGKLIDPSNMGKLNKTIEEFEVKQKAFKAVRELEGKSLSEKKKILSGIQNVKVKAKALEVNDNIERQRENLERRASKKASDELLLDIRKQAQAGKPYSTMIELESDTTRHILLSRVTNPKDFKTIVQSIKAPSGESNPEAYGRMADAYVERGFNGMSWSEFSELSVDLSGKDARRWRNRWESENKSASLPQERAQHRALMKDVRSKAFVNKIIKKPTGTLSRIDQERLNNLSKRVQEKLGYAPTTLKEGETDKFTSDIIAEDIKQRGGTSSIFDTMLNFVGLGDEPVETRRPFEAIDKPFLKLPEDVRDKLEDEFEKEFGRRGTLKEMDEIARKRESK